MCNLKQTVSVWNKQWAVTDVSCLEPSGVCVCMYLLAWCCCIPLHYISHKCMRSMFLLCCVCVCARACVQFFPMALRQTQRWLDGASAIRLKFDQSDSMLKTDTHTQRHTIAVTIISSLHSFACVYMCVCTTLFDFEMFFVSNFSKFPNLDLILWHILYRAD